MILSCPSCGTLYRYAGAPAASRARCTCCDGAVPVAMRRHYALSAVPRAETLVGRGDWPRKAEPFRAERIPAATAGLPAASMIGMDDPSLAPRLHRTALDGVAHGSAQPAAMSWSLRVDREVEPDLPAVTAAETAAAAESERAAPRRGRIVLVPVILGGVTGALAGFAGSTWLGGSVSNWWIGGTLVGVAFVLGVRGSWTSLND